MSAESARLGSGALCVVDADVAQPNSGASTASLFAWPPDPDRDEIFNSAEFDIARWRMVRQRCDKLVHVSVGSAEVLPAGAGFAHEFDAGLPQLRDRLGQVGDLEANNGAGLEMPFARVLPAEHLDVLPVGEFEDPEMRLGVDQIETQHVLIEQCQSLRTISTRPAPAEAPYVHT